MATTYALVVGSEVNCAVTPLVSSDGTFGVVPAAAGEWSFVYEIVCDGVYTKARATASGLAVSAVPVDDSIASPRTVGIATATAVDANDTPCPSGVTTWEVVAGSETNCTATPTVVTDGIFNVTALDEGAWQFRYRILCDATVCGTATATVSGTALFVVDAVNDVDPTPREVDVPFVYEVDPNDTTCGSTATTTYVLVASSETNCTVAGSPSADGTFTITPTNCASGCVAIDDVVAGTGLAGGTVATNVAGNDTPCGTAVWSFRYEIYCNGDPTGETATVSGTAFCPPTPVAVNDVDLIVHMPGAAFAFDVAGNDTTTC